MEKKTKINFNWEQFFVTVLGTAIGVALTFVVDGMMARHNKEQAQRLTAIMVIHDIDNSIDVLKNLKEKIFNSDLDTWQNLGNMAFLDNVQSFYHDRQELQDALNQSTMWQRPIPDEEFMQFIMGTGWVTAEEFAAALLPFLKEKLHEIKVAYYINVSSSRLDSMTQVIDYWTGLDDENKFLMGITDQELEEYVSNINKKGVSLTRSKLLGRWVLAEGDRTFFD